MASQRVKFTVGLFVASGIGIAVAAFIWLGMTRYWEKGQYYVSYFDESVQGLTVDSPVKYRGVSIGRVESIGVAPDSRLIQVVLKIETGQPLGTDVVAQLKSVGITGSMFLELDRKREGEPDQSPTITFPSEYPIIASKPSDISELVRGLDDALNQIKALDLKTISGKVKVTLDNINQKVSEANVEAISNNLESSLARIDRILEDQKWDNILASVEKASQSLNILMTRADSSLSHVETTFARVEGIVADEEKTIKEAIEDFRRAMENANILLQKGSLLIARTDDTVSQLSGHLLVVTQNLRTASENLNQLIELVSDQPSQLLFGEPPPPRKLETGTETR